MDTDKKLVLSAIAKDSWRPDSPTAVNDLRLVIVALAKDVQELQSKLEEMTPTLEETLRRIASE